MSYQNGESPEQGQKVLDASFIPPAAEIEQALAQIAGIRAARVVSGANGKIAEVHVLAEQGRGAKQLVRDIQSAVLTGFGISIDYRVVSVVQLDAPATTKTTATPTVRPVLRRLSAETASFSTEVRVGVAVAGEEVARSMRGPATSGLRLVAQATVDAVGDAVNAEAVDVEAASIVEAGGRSVALVVVRVLTSRGDHVVSGSAVVRRDPSDAVARATLDALNRFFGSE